MESFKKGAAQPHVYPDDIKKYSNTISTNRYSGKDYIRV